jgi:hypothetical protein
LQIISFRGLIFLKETKSIARRVKETKSGLAEKYNQEPFGPFRWKWKSIEKRVIKCNS